MADDLRLIGIDQPSTLAGADPFVLYETLNARRGQRQDPCVLDTLMAVTDFMGGAPPRPWWHYTAQRKRDTGCRAGASAAPAAAVPPAAHPPAAPG